MVGVIVGVGVDATAAVGVEALEDRPDRRVRLRRVRTERSHAPASPAPAARAPSALVVVAIALSITARIPLERDRPEGANGVGLEG